MNSIYFLFLFFNLLGIFLVMVIKCLIEIREIRFVLDYSCRYLVLRLGRYGKVVVYFILDRNYMGIRIG